MDIDCQTFFPQLRRRSSRATLRLFTGRMIREYNDAIQRAAAAFQPDFLLAFKAPYVSATTLHLLRQRRVPLYNYFPDRMMVAVGTPMEKALPEYDCVFDTKRSWDSDTAKRIRLRNSVFLPHGYDPEIHHPVELDERDLAQYECDVSLVATHMPVKEKLIEELLQLRPGLDLRIWGTQWGEYCRSSLVRNFTNGPLRGLAYAKALRATRINLGIMGIRTVAKDETSTRTYEIPACGGFMLHERSAEVLGLYREGKEIECFSSLQELAEKIDYYLAHAEERLAIARAGHLRCVPAYSYDNRMAEILHWHAQQQGEGARMTAAVAAMNQQGIRA
jgi:spore maturation protein CgeB